MPEIQVEFATLERIPVLSVLNKERLEAESRYFNLPSAASLRD